MDYKQLALPEERETHINIDYMDKKIIVYTNAATVMRRFIRKGYRPTKEEKVDGEVYALIFEFNFKDKKLPIAKGIFNIS